MSPLTEQLLLVFAVKIPQIRRVIKKNYKFLDVQLVRILQ